MTPCKHNHTPPSQQEDKREKNLHKPTNCWNLQLGRRGGVSSASQVLPREASLWRTAGGELVRRRSRQKQKSYGAPAKQLRAQEVLLLKAVISSLRRWQRRQKRISTGDLGEAMQTALTASKSPNPLRGSGALEIFSCSKPSHGAPSMEIVWPRRAPPPCARILRWCHLHELTSEGWRVAGFLPRGKVCDRNLATHPNMLVKVWSKSWPLSGGGGKECLPCDVAGDPSGEPGERILCSDLPTSDGLLHRHLTAQGGTTTSPPCGYPEDNAHTLATQGNRVMVSQTTAGCGRPSATETKRKQHLEMILAIT